MAKGRRGFQPTTPYPEEPESDGGGIELDEIQVEPAMISKEQIYELPQTDLKFDGSTVQVTRLVLTPELVAIAIYEARGMLSVAAKKLSTTIRTVKGFVDREEICRVAYEEADEMLLDFVEAKLYQKIKAGDIASIIFYMRTKGKRRGYTEKTQDHDESDPATKHAQLQEQEDKQRELETRLRDISGRLLVGNLFAPAPATDEEAPPEALEGTIDLNSDEYSSE